MAHKNSYKHTLAPLPTHMLLTSKKTIDTIISNNWRISSSGLILGDSPHPSVTRLEKAEISVEPADEGSYGGDILAVRDYFALEFNASIGAKLTFEIGTEHFLALGAVPETNR